MGPEWLQFVAAWFAFAGERLPELWFRTGQHMVLTGVSTGLAIAIGVPLGILASIRPWLRGAVLATIGGVRQIVQFARSNCFGVTADEGKLLWTFASANNGTANCSTPVVSGNYVVGAVVFLILALIQFIVIAMLVCLSLVPVSLAPTKAPKPVASAKLRLGALVRLSKSGVIGCAAIGLVEGSFWTFGPIFAQGQGLPVTQITLFMSMFMVGGTLSQWPLGHLSDRIDRRYVVIACCAGTVTTSLVLAFVPLGGMALNSVVAGLHGACMIPLYALLLAHTNDYAPREALVEVSSGLLLVYALGAATGPLLVGPLMQVVGRGGLFLAIAAVLTAFTLFVLLRLLVRGRAGEETRVEFVPVPKTTQSVYALEEPDAEAADSTD